MIHKIIEVIKTLLYPIMFVIGQFIIMGIFMIICLTQNPNIDLNSSDSSSILNNFINDNTLLILLLECLIFMPLFYFKYKKYRVDKIEYSTKELFLILVKACILSFVFNFLIILIKSLFNIFMGDSSISLIVILSTGIIGPIIEEFLFRGIVYEKLSRIFKYKVAFYLSIFIFAIFHTGGIFQIFFAAIIGYYLTNIYCKYHDIRLSIFAHVVVNMTSILSTPLILLLF